MATITNKQRLLAQVFAALYKRGHGAETPPPEERPVLEQFLFAICREGVSYERAAQAFRHLQEKFFDWNEVRVSSVREVAEALGDLPQATQRAQRIIALLQEVFETTFSFDLDGLRKKGLKQAAKQLSRYQAANDYAVAWVMQRSLGGHALPLDLPSVRVLRRLGLIEDNLEDLAVVRAGLEHHIPKARGALFTDLISALAEDYCWEENPCCTSCPLVAFCPTGQELRGSATKPHKSR